MAGRDFVLITKKQFMSCLCFFAPCAVYSALSFADLAFERKFFVLSEITSAEEGGAGRQGRRKGLKARSPQLHGTPMKGESASLEAAIFTGFGAEISIETV